MIRLVNFADDQMTRAQIECTESAYPSGVDQVFQYNPSHISNEFDNMNREIFHTGARGAGYWLWKPYFIFRALQHCNEGDILIYCDSGVKIIHPVQAIIDVMDQDIFLFTNGWPHVEWCKMDVMNEINGWVFCNGIKDPALTINQQVQASVIFFKVNQTTRNFVKEWLLWCQMPGFIDDSPSVLPNYPTFAEHRHDQAILTCLQIKYGYKLHWWASDVWVNERHRWPEDKYPAMFNHHRYRNSDYK